MFVESSIVLVTLWAKVKVKFEIQTEVSMHLSGHVFH